jgi:hypothetical protein
MPTLPARETWQLLTRRRDKFCGFGDMKREIALIKRQEKALDEVLPFGAMAMFRG